MALHVGSLVPTCTLDPQCSCFGMALYEPQCARSVTRLAPRQVPGFKVTREWSDLSYTVVRDLPVVDGIQPPGTDLQ